MSSRDSLFAVTNRVTKRLEKIAKFFKNIPKSCQVKKGQNIHNKAQFESPKHLQQTTFETLKYLQQSYFESAYLGENLINLLKQKVAQKVAIILGYFILSRNHKKPTKVAQLAKSPNLVTLVTNEKKVYNADKNIDT
jgi:hypothetical protein